MHIEFSGLFRSGTCPGTMCTILGTGGKTHESDFDENENTRLQYVVRQREFISKVSPLKLAGRGTLCILCTSAVSACDSLTVSVKNSAGSPSSGLSSSIFIAHSK